MRQVGSRAKHCIECLHFCYISAIVGSQSSNNIIYTGVDSALSVFFALLLGLLVGCFVCLFVCVFVCLFVCALLELFGL